MQICPSILETKAKDYLRQIERLSPYVQYFQIDIIDGVYQNKKTAGIDEVIFSLEQLDEEMTKKLFFDFHLMVKDYEKHLKKILTINKNIVVKNIFIHYDLYPNLIDLASKYPFPIGLVLNPQDQIKDFACHYNLLDLPTVQIMSVIPGAQGNPFIPDTLNKIEQLRDMDYRNNIYLDGGINEKTLPVIYAKKYKPDVVCPGSFLTKCPDEKLKQNIQFLISNS